MSIRLSTHRGSTLMRVDTSGTVCGAVGWGSGSARGAQDSRGPHTTAGWGQRGRVGGADAPERVGLGAGHEWGRAGGSGNLEAGVPGRSHCLSRGCVG